MYNLLQNIFLYFLLTLSLSLNAIAQNGGNNIPGIIRDDEPSKPYPESEFADKKSSSTKSSLTITGNSDIDFKKLATLKEEYERDYYPVSVGKVPSSEEIRQRRELTRLHKEKVGERFREFGLQLWKYYPNDERRYEWFQYTILMEGSSQLNYWDNIETGHEKYYTRSSYTASYTAPINWPALEEWEKMYPEMKQNYFLHFLNKKNKSNFYDPANKFVFSVIELEYFLRLSLNSVYRNRDGNNKIDLQKLEQLIVQAAAILAIDDTTLIGNSSASSFKTLPLRALDNDFLARYNAYGLTDTDILTLLSRFIKQNDNSGLKMWAIQRRSLLRLKKEPLELSGTAINGQEVNLKKMKGKVVLIDFWSIWCSSCIARMPAIKNMYDKYRNKGFEVISVCFNDNDKLAEVKKIEAKIGAAWPILLVGSSLKESQGRSIQNKYGFFGVPQLLLFDKSGKLILLNDVLRDGDFEPILIKLLNG